MKIYLLYPFILISFLNAYAGSNSDATMEQASAFVGAGVNYSTAKSLRRPCADPDESAWACPMMMMSYAQAALQVIGALKAGQTANATSMNDYQFDDFNFDNLDSLDSFSKQPGLDDKSSEMVGGITSGIKDLAAKGYSVDKDTGKITTPSGEYNASDFNSGSSMANAGIISPDEISEVDAKIKKILADAPKISPHNVVKGSYGTPSGVGGGGSSGGYSNSDVNPFDYNSLFKRNSARDPAKAISTAGMVKMVNGSPIGVSADNIFEMIKRRCAVHIKNNKYIEK